MRTLRALTVLIILSTLASSCSGGGGLLDYRAEKCTFDLVFEADTGDGGVRRVRWNAEKNGENFTLSLAGDGGDAVVVIEYDGENVYLCASSMRIPLSDKASETLRLTLATIFPKGDIAASVRRDGDGERTVLSLDGGEVTLGADLLPCHVTVRVAGGERHIIIENYTAEAET